jgi:hypothetical protein
MASLKKNSLYNMLQNFKVKQKLNYKMLGCFSHGYCLMWGTQQIFFS